MTKLVVLGLLLQGDMHGYEIQQTIEQSKVDQWSNILSGSIYYAIAKLEKEELICAKKVESTGKRVKTIYSITEKGKEEFNALLKQTLVSSPHQVQSNFNVALHWINTISKEEVKNLLEENISKLIEIKRYWETGLKIKENVLSPYEKASFIYTFKMIDLDIEYLKEILIVIEKN